MKSFIFASLLFLILVISIIANSIYINSSIERLMEMSDALKTGRDPDFYSNLEKFEEDWLKFKTIARITCTHSELNRIDLIIEEIRASYSVGYYENCSILQAKLKAEIKELRRLESMPFY